MGVTLSHAGRLVPEEFLRGGEVVCPHYKVRREGVAQVVESKILDSGEV